MILALSKACWGFMLLRSGFFGNKFSVLKVFKEVIIHILFCMGGSICFSVHFKQPAQLEESQTHKKQRQTRKRRSWSERGR